MSSVMVPMELNTKFEELCRLCGCKTDMLAVHIFDEEGSFSDLGQKIYSCLQIQIHQQDELPKLLCKSCIVKLEMFWDFKDSSFRTEQVLIELYKQLKHNGVVRLDASGIIMQVSNHLMGHELPAEIDISELGRRGQNLNYDDIPQLENLDHDLSAHNLSNHQPENLMSLNGNNSNSDSIGLHMLNDFKLSHLESNAIMYQSNLKYEQNLPNNFSGEGIDDNSSDNEKLVIDTHLSDNSLGVEVDSQFDRIISYSSDSQLDHINNQSEEVLMNFVPDHQSVELQHKPDLFQFPETHINSKEEISLDSMNSFRDEEENSAALPSEESSNDKSMACDDAKEIPVININATKSHGKVCHFCGKTFKTNYKLTQHMTKHTGERPFKCGSCDKSFRSKIGLTQHEAKHTGQYIYSCETCGKGFQSKSYLVVHQRVHSDVKPYPCETCGLNFKSKQSLLDHTNRHLGVKPYTCGTCNRGFITKSLCVQHEQTHSGVDNRKYSCKICQKRFVSKSYLQTHSKIHTGEKPFICEVCGKGFITRVDLKLHMTMHTGEKSYVCEMCGKAFARRDALKCHRRMHTGEKPYRCDICGRSFTQFTPMANHRRNHSGDKPFTCELCGKKFVFKSSMMTHQKKHKKTDNAEVKEIDVPQFEFVAANLENEALDIKIETFDHSVVDSVKY